MQKTGGSHIRRLLERYTDGKAVGKHNRLTDKYADHFVFGSIRNPWDWYVSLWAYGVSGRGAIRGRCVSGVDFTYYHRMLPQAMGKHWLTPLELTRSIYQDFIKPVSAWKVAYNDVNNPKLFRQWLNRLLNEERRFDFGEGYGFSPISRHAGLFTYRYFRLFTRGDHVFKDRRLNHFEGTVAFDQDFNIAGDMIRTESLEEDFIRIISTAGYALTVEELNAIRNMDGGKTNVSQRQSTAFYYDDATFDLVANKERYLIEKYGYTPII